MLRRIEMPNVYGFEPLTAEEEQIVAENRYVICFHRRAVGDEPYIGNSETFRGQPIVWKSVDDAKEYVKDLNERLPEYIRWLEWHPRQT